MATSDYCSIFSNTDVDAEFLGNTNSHLCASECSGDLRDYCDVITQHIASFLDATNNNSLCHQVSCSKNPADGSTHIYINLLDQSDANKVKSTKFWNSLTSSDLSFQSDLGSRPQCLGKEATPVSGTLTRSNITCLGHKSPGPRCNITTWLQEIDDDHSSNSPQTDQPMAPLSGHGLLHATSVDSLDCLDQYHSQNQRDSTTKHRSLLKSFKKFLSRLHKK